MAIDDNVATYTPSANSNGSDSFAFVVIDDNNVSSQPAIVTIAVSVANE